MTGAFFPAGNACPKKVDAKFPELFAAADGINKIGVSSVDEDIPFGEQREKLFDILVDRLPALTIRTILRGISREATNSSIE
jgi:hypothetical protein